MLFTTFSHSAQNNTANCAMYTFIFKISRVVFPGYTTIFHHIWALTQQKLSSHEQVQPATAFSQSIHLFIAGLYAPLNHSGGHKHRSCVHPSNTHTYSGVPTHLRWYNLVQWGWGWFLQNPNWLTCLETIGGTCSIQVNIVLVNFKELFQNIFDDLTKRLVILLQR